MINSIRGLRRAKGLTLEEVAARCVPPTTAQTIGRLETGTRTLSLGWLNRIAAALDVEPRELVRMNEEEAIAIAAVIDHDGAQAPTREEILPVLRPDAGMVAVRIDAALGDYRSGDILWCRRLARDALSSVLNRDILVPRSAGRFAFGRLLAIDGDRMQIIPPTPGARQQVVAVPDWVAVTVRLIRSLGQ